MFENVMPEKAIAFVRLSVILNCSWPLTSMATKAQIFCYRILKVLCGISAFALFLPLVNAVIVHFGDATNFSKAIIMTIASGQILVQLLISSTQHDRWQRVIEHMIVSLKNAKSYERNVYQRYVDSYCMFYGVTVMWYYLSLIVILIGSIFLPQPFVTIAEYPFRVDYEPVRTIIFLHQAFVGFQCAASVSLNTFAAMLLLYAAARYEILMIDLRESCSIDALTMCVKKYYSDTSKRFCKLSRIFPNLSHSKWVVALIILITLISLAISLFLQRPHHYHEILSVLFRFAKDVIDATQYIVWFTILSSSIALVLCGLIIIGRQLILVKLEFAIVAWTAMMEVFMCALPADVLINMSTNVVRSVYESTWYDQVLGVQKTVLRILVPQAPIIISLKCLIPELSLEYYCSYISNSVSLFTTMRMVLGEDADFLSSKTTNSSCCSD